MRVEEIDVEQGDVQTRFGDRSLGGESRSICVRATFEAENPNDSLFHRAHPPRPCVLADGFFL